MIPNLSKLRCLDGLPTDVQPSPGLSEEVFQELGEEIIDYLDIPDIVRVLALNKLASSRARTVLQSKLPILTVLMDPPFALNFSQIVSLETLNVAMLPWKSSESITIMARFAAAISIGALPLLRKLNLAMCNFEIEEMKVFFEAIGNGALPLLEVLHLDYNNLDDEGMKAFAAALDKGALPKLQTLGLGHNNFGEEGMEAFAAALYKGALPDLELLDIQNYWITDQIMDAFSTLLEYKQNSISEGKYQKGYYTLKQKGRTDLVWRKNTILDSRDYRSLEAVPLANPVV